MYPFFQCHNILNKIQKEKRKRKRVNAKFLVAIRIWKCSQPNIFESLKWFCHATKYGDPQKAAGGLLVWQFYCPLYSIFWYTLYICCRVLACWAIVWLQISWTLIFDLGTKNHRFFRSYQWKIMSVENENRSNGDLQTCCFILNNRSYFPCEEHNSLNRVNINSLLRFSQR